MRVSWLLLALVLVAGSDRDSAGQPPAADAARDNLPRPKYVKTQQFGIPFEFNGDANAVAGAVEIQLWASSDHGATWDAVQTARPNAARFRFRAAKDGEYWFMVRERDLATGKLSPPGAPAPEMRVIVDAAPPEIELRADRTENGKIEVFWRYRDLHADSRSFQIEYRATTGRAAWIPVSTLPAEAEPDVDHWIVGEKTLTVENQPGPLAFRAAIRDLAGNRAETLATTQREPAPSRSPAAEKRIDNPRRRPGVNLSTGTRPVNGTSRNGAAGDTYGHLSKQDAAEPPPRQRNPTTKFPTERGDKRADPRLSDDDPSPRIADRFPSSPRAGDEQAPAPNEKESLPSPGNTGDADRLDLPAPSQTKDAGRWREKTLAGERGKPAVSPAKYPRTKTPEGDPAATVAAEEIPPGDPEIAPEPDRGQTRPSKKPLAENGAPGAQRGLRPSPLRPVHLPAGVEPKRIDFTHFKLEYQVDQVGSSGVKHVELWCTRDGGKTWQTIGEDPDNVSPMTVQVDDEGTYGFKLVVCNGSGLKGRTPRAGDMPEYWVVVDLTTPEASLISAEPGAQGGTLVIRWQASDSDLAEWPIALSYSESPEGPWTPIAAGLENTGSYAWALDETVPEQAYVRLEARDSAGNVGVSVSPTAIPTAQARPEAPILDVRPAAETSRPGRRVYNLR